MPDTSNPAPAQQKQKRLALAFLYASKGGEASKGEAVLKQLGEEKSYATIFPAATAEIIRAYHDGSLKKEDYAADDFIDRVVKPVMEDFLDITCPSVKGKQQIAQWVFKQYLTHRQKGRPLKKSHPIKARDLHKIGENIDYFDSLKKSGALRNTEVKPDLMSYKTYAAFEEMLAPYLERRAKNKAVAASFNMSAQDKAQVMAETTMLYNGPEGNVVVVHSADASNYWGMNTRWCICSTRWRNYRINFPHYDKISPIIMLIPKGLPADKVALIDKTFINSRDQKIATLPRPHYDLMQSCLAGLSEGARKGIEPWLPEATALDGHLLKDSHAKHAARKLRHGLDFVASIDIRQPTKKDAWRPDKTRLTARRAKALARIAEEGDREKLVQQSRRYRPSWVDAETFLAADPVATVRKIETEMATKRSSRSPVHP